jgi:hypothetical protein
MNTNSSWPLTVGTTAKSMAIISERWLLRNVHHPWDGGRLGRDGTLGNSPPFVAKSRILSRFEATRDGRWKFDIMSRVTEGQPTTDAF